MRALWKTAMLRTDGGMLETGASPPRGFYDKASHVRRFLLMVLAALSVFAAPALAGDGQVTDNGPAQPVSEIRAVTQKLDQIANRGASPPALLGQALEQYGMLIRKAAAPEQNRQLLREHAEIFVLSGGDASVLKSLEVGLEADTQEKKLFDGVLAYGGGRAREAETLLLALNPLSFDAMRGGHLALAQALLASPANPQRAFESFEKARFLLPGTLVEEAALRQTAILAARTRDKERFHNAAASYLARFRRSAYIAGFETQLAFHIVRFDVREGELILQALLKAHPQGWGRCLSCFLASIAGQAVMLGRIGLARAAAEAALPLAPDGSADKQRLLLYHGAALIVTEDYARGINALNAVEPSGLEGKDKDLLSASLALAAKLRATPMPLDSSKLDASVSFLPNPTHDRNFLPGRSQAQAKAVLASVDAMLAQTR